MCEKLFPLIIIHTSIQRIESDSKSYNYQQNERGDIVNYTWIIHNRLYARFAIANEYNNHRLALGITDIYIHIARDHPWLARLSQVAANQLLWFTAGMLYRLTFPMAPPTKSR